MKSYLADIVNEMKMWTVSKRNISTEKELAGRLYSFYVAQSGGADSQAVAKTISGETLKIV